MNDYWDCEVCGCQNEGGNWCVSCGEYRVQTIPVYDYELDNPEN